MFYPEDGLNAQLKELMGLTRDDIGELDDILAEISEDGDVFEDQWWALAWSCWQSGAIAAHFDGQRITPLRVFGIAAV